MSGISPTMMIAATGFTNNQGLGVSSAMLTALTNFDNSPVVTLYTNVISALNGANVALPTMPSYFTGLSGGETGTSITNSIRTAATAIAPNTQKFISNFNSASTFAQTSFTWSGALTGAASASFDSFGLGISNFSQMVSGGVGTIMAGANGAAADFTALSSTITKFGSAFDSSNPQKMFDPAGFVKNLQKQGLGDVGGLGDKLSEAGLDPTNLDSANPEVIKQVLETITGLDVAKIISQTKMIVPANTMISSAADLLNAKKIVSASELAALPGGSLDGLGNALTNMGGKFKTAAAMAASLAATKIPSLKHLDALSSPMPASISSALSSKLGSGGGPFGNPTINDIIGTAAGYKHTEGFTTLVSAHTAILATAEGQSLQSAANALIADPSNPSTLSAFVSAQSAVTGATSPVLAKLISDSSTSITASQTQLTNEATNQSKAGFVPSAATVPAAPALLGFANKLHDMGLDKQQVGYNFLFSSMATDDQYGDAIKAALAEGQNIAKSAAAGIANTTKIDPMAVLAKIQNG
jgi:hypothetical protein